MKKNQDLIDVFQDTKDKFAGTACLSETAVCSLDAVKKPNIVVKNQDTVSAIVESYGKASICALNMASYKRPGGGVENGTRAQEEGLFRCSDLFRSIDKALYPIQSGEFLYTSNVTFIKDFDYKDMPWVTADIISVPAINLNSKSYYDPIKEDWVDCVENKPEGYEELTKAKIRAMLLVAGKNQAKIMILGAWGCGVFKNSPEDIARMFKEVLVDENYHILFDEIIFPIINDHNSHGNNYEVFKSVLE